MSKKIIVRTEDNKIWKEFEGVGNCAEFFKKTKAVIYNRCATPDRLFLELGINLKFESPSTKVRGTGGERRDKRFKDTNVEEAKLRANETEDQTRRRLGLNPYGEWRNDEWLYAMFARVDKMLYPQGYDEHAAWLSMKGKERLEKNKTRVSAETWEESYKDIDDEFKDYIK